ncbi:hypothetical protein PYCC9005_004838 [Savitreella phatthalungensis]
MVLLAGMQMELGGAHVLVTGASGGVGSVAVRKFLEAGCRVTAQVNRNLESLRELTCEALRIVQTDVTDERQVSELFTGLPVDILILNHGVFRSQDIPIEEMTLGEWRDTIDVNLTGSFLVARAYFRQLDKAACRSPSITIVGSTAGKFGEAQHVDYASSKSALQYGFTLSLKNEIVRKHHQGRVNAVAPGWILTPMAEASMRDPLTRFQALGTTPLRKIATPDDVVNVILFLSSPLAGHITGQCIMVEGGMEGRVLNSQDSL